MCGLFGAPIDGSTGVRSLGGGGRWGGSERPVRRDVQNRKQTPLSGVRREEGIRVLCANARKKNTSRDIISRFPSEKEQ